MRADGQELLPERDPAQEQLGAAFEHSPDAVAIINEAGLIVLVNEQTELLFGYQRSELLGQPVELLVPDRLIPAHLQHRNEFIQAPQVRLMGIGLELAGRRKDGSEFPVHISLGPLQLDGRPFVIATVRDVTERLHAQEQKRELDELRRRRQDAFELNDSVVQQIATARLALNLGEHARADDLMERALHAAQTIVSELLTEQTGKPGARVRPGELVRSSAAGGNT